MSHASPPEEPRRSSCTICGGFGWVCEDHIDKPWRHDGCAGAGAPCVCNPGAEVQWEQVFAQLERPGVSDPLQ